MDEAALGLKVDATGVQAATKALEDFADQGAKTEKAMAGVEGAAAKTGKSLKTLGDGASKGLDDIGKSAPAAAESVGRVAKSAEDAKRALAGINASVASLGQVTTAATQSARGMDGFATSLLASQKSLMDMQAQVRAASTAVAQMGAVLATVAPAAQAAAKAQADAAKSAVEMGAAFKAASDQMKGYSASTQQSFAASKESAAGAAEAFGLFRTALVGIASISVVKQFATLADTMTNINSRLKLVTASSQELALVQSSLFSAAQNSRVRFDDLVGTYAQMSRATKELGISQRDMLKVTETISQAVTISGGSAASAQAALVQLSQGFASGTLRGEELNSVLEQTPRLAQAIAQGLGVSTGELRKLGAEGELTAEKVLGALQKSSERVKIEFDQMSVTIEQSLTRVNNSMLNLVGTVDQLSGASSGIASVFSRFSSNLDSLDGQIKTMASVNSLSDFFFAAFNTEERLNAELAVTQKELNELRSRLEANPNNIYLKSSTADAQSLVNQINAAITRIGVLKQVSGGVSASVVGDPYNDGSSYEGFQKQEKAREDAAKRMAEITARQNGITKQFRADLKTWEDNFTLGLLGGGDPVKAAKEYADAINALNKKRYESTEAGKEAAKRARASTVGVARIAKADLASDITDIQLQYRMLTTASGNAERLLDAQRAAGLVSEREYYAQKRKFVEDNAALQIRELEDENKRYAQQAATGADKINNEKKIAQNTAKMAEIRAKADTDIKISTLQQEEANRQLEASYKALEQSMAGYLKTSADRYQRELQGMGLGNQWRDQNAAANQINDRYEAQRNDLRNNRERLELEKKWNSDLEEQYQRRLEIINDANQKALGLDADYWRRRLQLQQDWTVGASEALTNYLNDANNTAALTEKAFTNGISGMEDALVSFVTTGKLSFTQLANSIIADITRIIIKQQLAAAIGGGGGMNWLGGLVGGLFGTTGTAAVASALPGNSLDNFLNLNNNFVANAKGGVYDSPSLSMYSNQVHSTPKVFAFAKGAGVFAEAGPEAIMPLTRNSAGVLGVRAMRDSAGGDGAGNSRRSGAAININIPVEGRVDRSTKDQIAARAAQALRRAERLS